ncbi:Zn-dependent exopeptidase [Jaminaea rosea]|uniref:Zn-dependent exopeptidase n=1 Tax=Jaminaea rosea TaxID=1569628 RepID=A0A316V125_9BASI|nr:Zn-dependent exopeptidase [Jaminaea rosea]PWN29873.1 Zn-dependent exopeptidase [Jaminaea rosea]
MAQRSLLATQRRDEKLPSSGAAADEQQHCQAGVERQRRRGGRALLSLVLLLGLTLFVFPATIRSSPEGLDERIVRWIFSSSPSVAATAAEGSRVCPQVEPWTGPGEDAPHVEYPSAEQMGERLSGAVQIDTSVHDDEPPPEEDPSLWSSRFDPLRAFFSRTFPRTHDADGPVQLELVHAHGLLYTWPGRNASLKPLLLMAHQDVVPVDPATLSEWISPPFEGRVINDTVIGRGAADIKSLVVSILSAVEALIESGFSPERTLLVSFGYDEEVSGRYGGQALAARIEEVYGRDGVAMIVDEGNPVVSRYDSAGVGMDLALPGVEEKGQAHIRIRIEGTGGHSSQPPPRTTIGLLSEFVASIEQEGGDNLKTAVIPDLDSAYLKMLQCIRDAPAVPHTVRQALKALDWAGRSSTSELLAASSHSPLRRLVIHAFAHPLDTRKRQRIERAKRALLAALPDHLKGQWRTTQTPTLFHGGIKLNAIPPSATVDIDHRVALHHDVPFVQRWYKERLTRFAKRHDLGLVAYGEEQHLDGGKAGKVILELAGAPLAPAPRTPTDASDPRAAPWRLFSSVIRSVWHSNTSSSSRPILVAPHQMTGNTDTRWMWRLSRHIFRFMPASLLPDALPAGSAFAGVHGVNEHYRVDGLERAVRFYAGLVRAVDAQGWD